MAENKCIVKYVVIKDDLFAILKEVTINANSMGQIKNYLNEMETRKWYIIEVKTDN